MSSDKMATCHDGGYKQEKKEGADIRRASMFACVFVTSVPACVLSVTPASACSLFRNLRRAPLVKAASLLQTRIIKTLMSAMTAVTVLSDTAARNEKLRYHLVGLDFVEFIKHW